MRTITSFSYAAPIQWQTFFITGVIAVGVAYLIVSFHSVRAARANPVHSLKHE